MDALLTTLAEQSPVAVVAVVSIWRISLVMMKLVDGFVAIATTQSDSVAELVEKQAAG